jgi:hypothetical protein
LASLITPIKTSTDNSNDESSLLAEAEAIFANPDEVLAKFGYVEEAALMA